VSASWLFFIGRAGRDAEARLPIQQPYPFFPPGQNEITHERRTRFRLASDMEAMGSRRAAFPDDVSRQGRESMKKVSVMGTDYSITVTKDDSGGALGVFEFVTPVGGGPTVHIHNNEDEEIHIIDGEFELWLDGKISRAGPGASAFVPRGVAHTFRVVGDRPGRGLAIVTPGGSENFFIELAEFLEAAERDRRNPEDMPELVELVARYGLQDLGPADWNT
jgi:quercetin dioxygenase-like cupin family protein